MKISLGRIVWGASSLLFFGFLLLPLLILMVVSFDPVAMVFPPKGFTLQWYAMILDKPDFLSSGLSSTIVALFTALISTTLGALAAVGLHNHTGRVKVFIQGLLLSPLFFPAVIVALALFQLMIMAGMMSNLALLVGAHVVVTLPYPVRNVLAQISGLNRSLEEAALTVGATPRQALFRVTLPMLKHSILPSLVLTFILSWNNYTVSVFLAGSNWTTLPLQLRAYLQYEYEPFIAAMSTILILISVLLLYLVERVFTRPAQSTPGH
jgi:putative spermidine/putrescine transport system permease protein